MWLSLYFSYFAMLSIHDNTQDIANNYVDDDDDYTNHTAIDYAYVH